MAAELLSIVRNVARLSALQRLGLLDTPPEAAFDRLTRVACRVLRAPVGLVSLVDHDRQFFKSCVGLPEPFASARETPVSHSFCQHVVATGKPLIVENARTNPLVQTESRGRGAGHRRLRRHSAGHERGAHDRQLLRD